MTWSGDGRYLVYSRTVDGVDQVFIAATDGSMRRQVTNDGQDSWAPTLSPDGRTIAFVKGYPRVVGIFVIQTDGSGERSITTGAIDEFEFAEWSPDGSALLYAARASDGDQDVWPAGLDGAPSRHLIAAPGNHYGATWSPDGLRIAYLGSDGGRVTVALADGSDPHSISEPGDWFWPQWSPDARHVLAVDGRNGGGQPIVAILDALGIAPMTSLAIPDVPGFGRADFASWQRLALP
jgi:TolB protein